MNKKQTDTVSKQVKNDKTSTQTIIFTAILGASFLIFAFLLFRYNFLILSQRFLVLALVLVLGIILFLISKKYNGWKRGLASGFSLLLSLFLIIGSFYLFKSFSALGRMVINEKNTVETQNKEELHAALTEEGFDLPEDFVIEEVVKVKEPEGDSFSIYISGIDRYGDIGGISRTDVNLVMNVNTKTHEILTTTIPRDSYVRIAGGGQNEYDKLTHSGIYGIQSSVETIENLFNIDINYYAKVNFTSLIEIVDVLNGVDVENDYAFTTNGGKSFSEGTIHLNGEDALTFSRERYNLPDGDFARGRNHVKVLEAIIRKAISPQILLNYTSLLDVVSTAVETNMPENKIMELINQQLASNPNWEFDSVQVKGTGSTGVLPSYAMPGFKLYMYQLDEQNVKDISQMMKDNLGK